MTGHEETGGWDAITKACEKVYGDQEPLHWAPEVPASLGGDDPLDGISCYRNQEEGGHWHYVTYGFSELYAKENDDPDHSGFGIELTFRSSADDGESPTDALKICNLLQRIADYVFETGKVFGPGHRMILSLESLWEETSLGAIIFAPDSQLGEIDSPNGKIEVLQVVGVTDDELERIKDGGAGIWSTDCLLEVLRDRSPLCLTDFGRASVLSNSDSRRKLDRLFEKSRPR